MSHNEHYNIVHIHPYVFALPSILSTDESFAFLPPFCPSLAPTIPAPRLPASLQPSPLPLPWSSIVSAWFSSLGLTPAVCSFALLLLCSLSQTQHSLPFGLRGGEGKHFTLQAQPGKQDSARTPELIYRLRVSECSPASIDLYLQC